MGAINILVMLTAIAVLSVLIAGGYSMARGGRFDLVHGFPLMEARVILQAIAISLIVIAIMFW